MARKKKKRAPSLTRGKAKLKKALGPTSAIGAGFSNTRSGRAGHRASRSRRDSKGRFA